MKQRFILFRRAGVYYCEDTTTLKQTSLRTKHEAEARTLLHSKNEAHRQPVLNLQIARTYLAASDPEISKRTWQVPMDEMTRTQTGSTMIRYTRAIQDKAFDIIRNLPILETHPAHFLKVLEAGTVATNVFLRRIHNFAIDMNSHGRCSRRSSGHRFASVRNEPSPKWSTRPSSPMRATRSAGRFRSFAGIWAAPNPTWPR